MKKINIFLLLPVLMASCLKEPDKSDLIVNKNNPTNNHISQEEVVKPTREQIEERTVTDTVITHVVDISTLPVEIQEEISNENQKLILQLKNINKTNISGHLIPESGQTNIRFNNIELNNQTIDGPFGKDFDYNLDPKGNYGIVIGKSLMASGSQVGKLKIVLK
ncbi:MULTISPECIES: hypothetical protein [Chryseobacterium]|jgi:hypothetical protein|uniref:Lipoprotein n=1 Tax=Chryseobacterium geocarposphaerae TaxID=1416776 RepID=A0ABU1LBG9_9FLAO|nr:MULTISPECIES: hypothetical protein [Chryseobacterium]MDR6404061.1 hypothetical protein [Chryseobacterium geocarposphaerae]MDR6698420.1 hypothetical protein [Chryseobacterium ginsenosidimutans]